jgi:pyridoxal phosphate enzyme (YggS family)
METNGGFAPETGETLKDRILRVRGRIATAALDCGRQPADVRLVAVSKTVPLQRLLKAIDLGLTVFGENYVQEARDKFNALYAHPLSWHFIGHLQSNKAKYVVKIFDLIHSVDSLKLSKEIDKQAGKIGKVQRVLVQVNIAEEATKSGVLLKDTTRLVTEMGQLNHLEVKGLMTLPPYFNAPEKVRPYFKALRQLGDQLRALQIPGVAMDELSMGMTGDFEVAIQEGATLVRIGTAIFGERA